MIADYKRTSDGRFIWPAHFAGIEREYCQIEKLANLDQIPKPHGFLVSCLPVKIQGASRPTPGEPDVETRRQCRRPRFHLFGVADAWRTGARVLDETCLRYLHRSSPQTENIAGSAGPGHAG